MHAYTLCIMELNYTLQEVICFVYDWEVDWWLNFIICGYIFKHSSYNVQLAKWEGKQVTFMFAAGRPISIYWVCSTSLFGVMASLSLPPFQLSLPPHWFFKASPSQAFLKASFIFSPLVWSLLAFVQYCPVVPNFERQHSTWLRLASNLDSGIQIHALPVINCMAWTCSPCWTLLSSSVKWE